MPGINLDLEFVEFFHGHIYGPLSPPQLWPYKQDIPENESEYEAICKGKANKKGDRKGLQLGLGLSQVIYRIQN